MAFTEQGPLWSKYSGGLELPWNKLDDLVHQEVAFDVNQVSQLAVLRQHQVPVCAPRTGTNTSEPPTTAGFSKGLPALPTEFTGRPVYF